MWDRLIARIKSEWAYHMGRPEAVVWADRTERIIYRDGWSSLCHGLLTAAAIAIPALAAGTYAAGLGGGAAVCFYVHREIGDYERSPTDAAWDLWAPVAALVVTSGVLLALGVIAP